VNPANKDVQITATGSGKTMIDAQQLIMNSREFLRSYKFDENTPTKRLFGSRVYPEVLIIEEQEADILKSNGIESYRLIR